MAMEMEMAIGLKMPGDGNGPSNNSIMVVFWHLLICDYDR